MKSIILICCLFLLSCSDMTDEKHIQIDQRIMPYYKKFIALSNYYGLDFKDTSIIIEVGPLEEGKTGFTFYESIVRIRMSQDYVNGLLNDPYPTPDLSFYLEHAVFHELGHALLRRDHVASDKISIMTCCMQNAWGYTNEVERPILQKELFKP